MDYKKDIIEQIELHDVDGIRNCFEHGVKPNDTFRGEPLIYELTSEYLRSPRFKECVRLFVDYGLEFEDKALLAVLLDDQSSLEEIIAKDPETLHRSFDLRCAYTPLTGVNLLHICAEFNHVQCAEALVEHGADVNATAGLDSHGFGGQSPIFHTVNQNGDQSAEMLDFLLSKGARLDLTVKGLIWGKGYDWETFIPSVNPISYAMMGLLPQMHRSEITISKTISKLLKHGYGIAYTPRNVPNTYLNS
ncbi:ankyrin repeat domain-containing protein [Muriicola marianensis]|uniref:Ankyrin repeat domain-containing protein n=1 Tax=Muriicola marianensis TaxID=1324801 RepID=A0ABQ1QX04_9FLAO|nr:ankyrin repeat domain-containing protein [Muriicola marianensis]GGD48001.1 hypothetical protein GCM10011361_13470 [Muriicola marianensis]